MRLQVGFLDESCCLSREAVLMFFLRVSSLLFSQGAVLGAFSRPRVVLCIAVRYILNNQLHIFEQSVMLI